MITIFPKIRIQDLLLKNQKPTFDRMLIPMCHTASRTKLQLAEFGKYSNLILTIFIENLTFKKNTILYVCVFLYT